MIIKTARHPLYFSIDLLLTSVGWLAFAWLITQGVLSLSVDPITPSIREINPLFPAISTLSAYLMIATMNAGLLALWALSHRRYGKRHPNSITINHFNSSSSSLYGIDPAKQKTLRNNRFSVIYHNTNGHITHVEAGS